MRYKHITLFAMILVSKIYCQGEYWMDNEGNFKWYGSRIMGLLAGEKYAHGGKRYQGIDFAHTTHSFRPTPETAPDLAPKIIIEFGFIARNLYQIEKERLPAEERRDILIQKITFTDYKLDEDLLEQTKKMGKTMVGLFINMLTEERIQGLDIIRNKDLLIELLVMFHRFLFKLQKEVNFNRDEKKALAIEFATGMSEYLKKFYTFLNFELSDDQIESIINFTEATVDLVCYYKSDSPDSHVYDNHAARTKDPNAPKYMASMPFSEYFLKIFMRILHLKETDILFDKLNQLFNPQYIETIIIENQGKINSGKATTTEIQIAKELIEQARKDLERIKKVKSTDIIEQIKKYIAKMLPYLEAISFISVQDHSYFKA